MKWTNVIVQRICAIGSKCMDIYVERLNEWMNEMNEKTSADWNEKQISPYDQGNNPEPHLPITTILE